MNNLLTRIKVEVWKRTIHYQKQNSIGKHSGWLVLPAAVDTFTSVIWTWECGIPGATIPSQPCVRRNHYINQMTMHRPFVPRLVDKPTETYMRSGFKYTLILATYFFSGTADKRKSYDCHVDCIDLFLATSDFECLFLHFDFSFILKWKIWQ